ncbi:protein kinase domain protein [Ichthyophthirius multifiliis]|uniref:Protein kinase domain protein n=1 Tax=Ichthyophthirius multifiliis TaxID=5932 RepID=G0R5K9_ICHMU|nr:protein kinase domain protein [Ichthyophthirius multifiliis]EGR27269.1 protein kinase domain protein [Ichthyophthirius multifiliis]|eukprot:XP_004024153.1 protein kinase domain protein [Ichthyophthirius multifiliis]
MILNIYLKFLNNYSYKINDFFQKKIIKEANLMNNFINHPYISNKVDFFIQKHDKTAYLIMKKVKGINLQQYISQNNKPSIYQIKRMLKQLLEAVQFLHQNNICHRDITTSNVIYNQKEEKVTLIDFSVAKQSINKQQLMWTHTGVIYFMAPEFFTDYFYKKSVDIWSIGVIFYFLLYGVLPFQSDNVQLLINLIIKQKIQCNNNLDDECKDFLEKLLEKDPQKRIQVQEALNHPFLVFFFFLKAMHIFFIYFKSNIKKLDWHKQKLCLQQQKILNYNQNHFQSLNSLSKTDFENFQQKQDDQIYSLKNINI